MSQAQAAALAEPAVAPKGVQMVSQRQRAWRTFKGNKTAVVGLGMILVIVGIALAAPLLSPSDPLDQSTRDRLASPGDGYLLGRDDFGRDILSRVIYGTRIALLVGLVSVALGGVVGTFIGVVAGYIGGRIETVLMRLVDILLAFPDLITGLLVLAVLGPGLWKMILAIAITIAPRFARLSYGPTMAVKAKDFVDAARSIGVGSPRILRVHILPNVAGELLVLASLWTASAIRLEASLSFIGLGVRPPTPTWGQMIRDGTTYLTNAPWIALAPGGALLLTVLAFNLVGDGLRDVLDPRSRA